MDTAEETNAFLKGLAIGFIVTILAYIM